MRIVLDRIRDRSDAYPGKRESDRDEAAGHDELRAAVVVVVVVVVVEVEMWPYVASAAVASLNQAVTAVRMLTSV